MRAPKLRERRQPRGRRAGRRAVLALLAGTTAVLAAAAPGVALAVQDLSTAQDRVDTALIATRAAVLAHDLADERDDLATRAAVGAPRLPDADRARTDRQAADVADGAAADLRTALAGLPAIRQRAQTGNGGPQAVVTAYQPLIDALGRLAGPVTAPLGRAVTAAAVERGLLAGALTGSGGQRALVTAARTARLQERAALGEFRATATARLRDRYDQTVTGSTATLADRDLATLLDGSQLTGSDRALGAARVTSALTARIDLMRSVETSAATDEARAAAAHRDHEVTVLELLAALAALCLLLLAGTLVTLFRGFTRPLAALHQWSKSDTDSGQGTEVIGADEFAAVARRVNALTHEAQALRSRAGELTAERAAATGAHSALAGEREALLRTQDDLLRSREELAARLADATAQNAMQITFVNLGLRTLGLVERQLALIEGLEDHEQDPDRLETFFKLDHLATRMRRNSENLLVLTGTEHSHGATARPVLLVDVARAAISEIERYERVRVQAVPEARVAGRAADDIAHLIAELLDNATAFSPPTAEVHVTGWLLESGEIMICVEDTGIGVPPERIDALNALLADPDPAPPGAVSGMGLYVVARLARRHGVRVEVRPRNGGGTAAVVLLPRLLLPVVGPDEQPGTPVEAALAGDTGLVPAPRTEQTGPGHIAPARFERVARQPAPAAVPEHVSDHPPGHAPEHVSEPVQAYEPRHLPQYETPYAPGQAPQHIPRPAPEAVEHARPAAEPYPLAGGSPGTGTLTPKGLPQRVPRSTGLTGASARQDRERQRSQERAHGGQVDAEELRRRLGGLQRGLRAGRRDADAENAVLAPHTANATHTAHTVNEARGTQADPGGPAATVEEATR